MTASPYGDAQNALDFALDHIDDAFERTGFLQCWRDGDVSEWPEYAGWLHANYRNEVLAKRDLMRRFGAHQNQCTNGDNAPDMAQPWFERAVRDHADEHGPGGDSWNISAILDCLRKASARQSA